MRLNTTEKKKLTAYFRERCQYRYAYQGTDGYYCKFNRCNIPKYRKYFDEWWHNLTLPQKLYLYAYSKGKKTYLQA